MSSTREKRWAGDAEQGNGLISSHEIFQADAFLDRVLAVTLSGSVALLQTQTLVTVAMDKFVFPSGMNNTNTHEGEYISLKPFIYTICAIATQPPFFVEQ